MALVYCGIDEAGYGPILGPLCFGCATFRFEDWRDGDPAPDLWSMLGRAVCRDGSDRLRRIAVDDSKKLKLANSSVRRHPLHHLERGVLSFLSAADAPEHGASPPETDLAFLRRLGVPVSPTGPGEWYGGEPRQFPDALSADEVMIAANSLRAALHAAGVTVLGLRADALFEGAFNELVEAAGTKAAATEAVLVRFLAEAWENHALTAEGEGGTALRVVCDRQGGRTQYAGMLTRAFPDAIVETVAETPAQSRYELRARATGSPSAGPRGARRMIVSFRVEAEAAHLPVALASMIAKLTRELLMARFNRYWCARMPDLKPTAGYALDARRWLRDVEAIASPVERRAMVRRT